MHTIRVHKPLWGGFPKHWLVGPVDALRLSESSSDASRYTIEQLGQIEPWLRDELPGAVITRDGI